MTAYTDDELKEAILDAAEARSGIGITRRTAWEPITESELEDLRAILGALQLGEWQPVSYDEINKGDKVMRVCTNPDGSRAWIEGVARYHHLTGWATNDHYVAHSDDDQNPSVQLFRIPAPAQDYPDAEMHQHIIVHRTVHQYYGGQGSDYPSFHYSWDDDLWRGDLSTVLVTEEILEWEPAKVVAANE